MQYQMSSEKLNIIEKEAKTYQQIIIKIVDDLTGTISAFNSSDIINAFKDDDKFVQGATDRLNDLLKIVEEYRVNAVDVVVAETQRYIDRTRELFTDIYIG